MRAIDCIIAKRDGKTLSSNDITCLCEAYQQGSVPDYQMSAFLMAVYFNGLNEEELFSLVNAMLHSGKQISVLSDNFVIDKHSTGGVGDKITLALIPILAALDFTVVKLTGRGLGHTGGTMDKLESLEGFHFNPNNISVDTMIKECNSALLGYSDELAPLDKKLYALRDVTGTVQSVPLIAASIMSKKLAVKSDGIILDVKVGSGAFMKTISEARELAHTMKSIGTQCNRKVCCVLSDMDQPLGKAVGNALELKEAIDVLQGKGPQDVKDLLSTLVGIAFAQRDNRVDYSNGFVMMQKVISNGKAMEMFEKFITLCGVDMNALHNNTYLGSPKTLEVCANETAHIKHIDALSIGHATMLLGAGRATKEDDICYTAGVILNKKKNDFVTKGEVLATLYYEDFITLDVLDTVKDIVQNAYVLCNDAKKEENIPLIHEVLM